MRGDGRLAARSVCLGILVFVCGWTLMMLEMLGARILAPCFGSDVYVWGSVIGVFLLALSVGYYAGGQLSARSPHATTLVVLIVCCAIWLGALPLVHRPFSDWMFDWWVAGHGGEDKWGSLMSAVALFLVPSVLLGTVSPFAIRLAATDVGSVGEKAGSLYAVSTIGSFLGCMMTSFYLIMWMGINRIIEVHAAVLLLTALAFGGAWSVLSRPKTPAQSEPRR
ncbi:MAG: glycosyl transferase [Armatimonadetes bacterium CG_4_10_14_3_um_filter_66_18]|nr:MAG: glycosyl transferase [Armatimonadetes bacterium CG_4_10_14_3_um_filter_66_18]